MMSDKGLKKWIRRIPSACYMLIFLLVLFTALVPEFLSPQNMAIIMRQAAPLLVLACGQTLIVLLQGTDLSLGSIVSMAGVLWILLLNLGMPMVLSILCVLAVSCLGGVLNGFLVAKGRLPVFIVTLGTQNIFKSAALLLCGSQTLYYRHTIFRTIARTSFLGLTWSVWISIFIFILTWLLLHMTGFGKKIKALGGNPEALSLSGGSVSRTTIMAFGYAGLMAGAAALLVCCRIESGNPNAGNGMEFNSIAAVLLGGTSMREGRGGVEGTVFGVLMMQVLKTGLTQVGISSIYQQAIIGSVVLAAIIMDVLFKGASIRKLPLGRISSSVLKNGPAEAVGSVTGKNGPAEVSGSVTGKNGSAGREED